MAKLEPHRLGETKKQEALPRPVRSDQKERPLGRQRRHDHRLERAVAEDAESREELTVRRHDARVYPTHGRMVSEP